MMGPHHAACGAAAWLALASKIEIGDVTLGLGLLGDMSPSSVLVGTVVTAGAALLPDIDHHSATLARSLPPFTNVIARMVGKTAGGHRHGTHSILGALVFWGIAYLLGLWTVESSTFGTVSIGAGIMSVLLVAFCLITFKIVSTKAKIAPWIVSIGLSILIALYAPETNNWLPIAVLIGVVAHIAGDMLTVGGVPLFMVTKGFHLLPKPTVDTPFYKRNGFMAVPVLGKTGSGREWLLATVIGGYALVGFGVSLYALVQQVAPAL